MASAVEQIAQVTTTDLEQRLQPDEKQGPSPTPELETLVAPKTIGMRNQQPKINSVETTLKRLLSCRVVELIYWKDVKKSAIVASSSLLLLICLSIFSVLSVISYISLAVLTVTFSFAVYKRTLAAIQKTSDGHPFSQYLEMDLTISPEKAQDYADVISSYMATYVGELRRLILIEDMVDSIKFGIFLWVMTYIGAWFNGLTLLILGLVTMFTMPKTYEVYQEQIDAYLALAHEQVKGLMAQTKQFMEETPKKLKEQLDVNVSHYANVVRKQLPKDFEEAKEMGLKLYQSLVELIQAKIPIGKKDQ